MDNHWSGRRYRCYDIAIKSNIVVSIVAADARVAYCIANLYFEVGVVVSAFYGAEIKKVTLPGSVKLHSVWLQAIGNVIGAVYGVGNDIILCATAAALCGKGEYDVAVVSCGQVKRKDSSRVTQPKTAATVVAVAGIDGGAGVDCIVHAAACVIESRTSRRLCRYKETAAVKVPIVND